MKRIVLPAMAALALLGALAVFLLVGDSGERRAAEGHAAGPATAAEPRGAGPSAELSAAATTGEAARPEAQSSADRRERIADAAVAAVPQGQLVLQILRAADETRVPGAEVLACLSTGADEGFDDLQKLDAWMEEHGQHLVADGHGEVRVPADPSGEVQTLVVARSAGLFGRGRFHAPQPGDESPAETALGLKPDIELSVLTVDERAQPVAGVGVSVQRGQFNWSYAVATLTTDAQGAARFRHVQLLRDTYSGDGPEYHWTVTLDVLTQAGIERPFDFEAPPKEPMRFVLPSTGTVQVRVLDVDGAPWTRSAQVTLEAIREGEPRELSPFGNDRRTTTTVEAKDGWARFPFVGLGFELALSATRQASSQHTRAYGPGPRRPGEEVRHDVVFGTANPVLQLRALGADGVPLAGKVIFAHVEIATQFMRSDYTLDPVAEADGRIRLDLDAGYAEKDRRILHLGVGSREQPAQSAVLDLSRKLEPGLHDLGDVYLMPPGVFVAGRVVDSAGTPVAGAALSLRKHKEEGGGAIWENIWDFDQRSHDDGTFDVRTPYEGTRFQISARKEGMRCLPLEFAPGESSLVVVLTGTGSLSGSVRLDPGLPAEKIRVSASPQGSSNDEHFMEWDEGRASVEEGGGFALRNLLPGVYDVTLEVEGSSGALHKVEGLVVAGGSDNADPRLQGIDLRGRLHHVHFALVAPEGRSVHQGNYQYGAAGDPNLQEWGWFNASEFDVLSELGSIDIDITVPGFQLVQLRGIADDQKVELSAGLSVRLIVRGDGELPEPPFFVKPALVPVDGSSHNIDWGAPALDERREVVVRAVTAGSMKVQWVVERRAPQGATATTVDATPEQTIQILPGVADQVFEIQLDQAQLDQILKALL